MSDPRKRWDHSPYVDCVFENFMALRLVDPSDEQAAIALREVLYHAFNAMKLAGLEYHYGAFDYPFDSPIY